MFSQSYTETSLPGGGRVCQVLARRGFFFFYAWMRSPLTIGGSNEMLTDPLECQQLPWLDADAREGL